jgi:hypothetical protein
MRNGHCNDARIDHSMHGDRKNPALVRGLSTVPPVPSSGNARVDWARNASTGREEAQRELHGAEAQEPERPPVYFDLMSYIKWMTPTLN